MYKFWNRWLFEINIQTNFSFMYLERPLTPYVHLELTSSMGNILQHTKEKRIKYFTPITNKQTISLN